jgi:hypothetical protein
MIEDQLRAADRLYEAIWDDVSNSDEVIAASMAYRAARGDGPLRREVRCDIPTTASRIDETLSVADEVAGLAHHPEGAFIASQTTVIRDLCAERDELRDIIESLVDPTDCRFDHDGACQEHNVLITGIRDQCPHARAKRLSAG